jgi:hypothetical protein
MADHKFVYTVSGVDLTEAHRHKISEAIGAAVAIALSSGAGTGKVAAADCLNLLKIYGGRWIPVELAEKVGFAEVMADKPGAAAAHGL